MKLYIKQHGIIKKTTLLQEGKWLEKKPTDADVHSYLCDIYIKTQGKNVRHLFSESSESEFEAQELKELISLKLKELDVYHYHSNDIRIITINDYFILSLSSEGRNLISEQIQQLNQKISKGLLTKDTALFEYFYNSSSVKITLNQLESLHIFMLDIVNTNFGVYKSHIHAINSLSSIEQLESYDFTGNYLKNQNINII